MDKVVHFEIPVDNVEQAQKFHKIIDDVFADMKRFAKTDNRYS